MRNKDLKSKTKRKLVYGKGINDADYPVYLYESIYIGDERKLKRIWTCPFYRKWVDMLARCYSDSYHKMFPSYVGCIVCDEWIRFSNFKDWMEQQDWEGKVLDKDLLLRSNKIYSPHTCLFISSDVNVFLTERGLCRGQYKIGVSWHKGNGKFVAQCRNPFTLKGETLGTFLTEEAAHQAWLAKKLEHAKALAALETNERIAKALISRYENYKEHPQMSEVY